MLTLRSLLFNAYLLVAALVGGALGLLLFWLPFRARWAYARGWATAATTACRVLCGIHVVTEGLENLPKRPSVALIKHTTTLETFWQLMTLPPQTWVLKRELMLFPFFGWAIWLLFRPIAINRKAGRAAVRQVITRGREFLADGVWVCIFPEGTRVAPGQTRRYGVSGAALAHDAGCLLVPVAHNAGDLWARRSFIKHPGTVRFCIGPPIDPAGLDPKKANLIAQEWIEGRMREISRLYRPSV